MHVVFALSHIWRKLFEPPKYICSFVIIRYITTPASEKIVDARILYSLRAHVEEVSVTLHRHDHLFVRLEELLPNPNKWLRLRLNSLSFLCIEPRAVNMFDQLFVMKFIILENKINQSIFSSNRLVHDAFRIINNLSI